ncbi:DNA recombination protein RmuC [Aurantivibrio plasticivorans]
MQPIQWTIELIALAMALGILLAALGYLVAMIIYKNTLSGINTKLAVVEEENKRLSKENYHLDHCIGEAENQLNDSKLKLKQLEVEVEHKTSTLDELKTEKDSLLNQLKKIGEELREAERQRESSGASAIELRAQLKDYGERLVAVQEELKAERTLVSNAKDDLAQEGKKTKELESSNAEAREQLKEVKQSIAAQQATYGQLQERYQSLSNEHTELKTTLEKREEHFKEQMEQLSETKQSLTKEFENLANKIFEEKGKTFTATSQTGIDNMLKPFREQIEGFQKRVNEVHDASLQNTTNLNAEIKKVLDVGLKMQDEANNLVTALKGDKKVQGTWSEVQAEILLEMSGLHKGREYERESSHKNDEGNTQRPDFIVRMPNEKHIIIDSKISLNAYVQSVSAETEEERDIYLKAHVDAIRKHVNDLSAKNYPKLKSLNTPEFVFMFMGNEPAYLAALNADPALAQNAYHKGIAIVTPNTLLSSLRIVSHLWSIDKQNSNTRELAEHASKVYDKLRVFVGKMEKLGGQIHTVSKSYEESWKTLKEGNGSLTKQVAKFIDMGVSVKERLPASVTEQGDMESLETSNVSDDSITIADELSLANEEKSEVEKN